MTVDCIRESGCLSVLICGALATAVTAQPQSALTAHVISSRSTRAPLPAKFLLGLRIPSGDPRESAGCISIQFAV